MKKMLLLLYVLLLLLPTGVFAENSNLPKIEVRGNKYYCMDNLLSIKQLEKQLKNVTETESEVKKAKFLRVSCWIFGGVGGYCVGYSITARELGSNNQLGVAGLGGAVIVVGVGIEKAMHHHYKKAIEIYNSKIINSSNN